MKSINDKLHFMNIMTNFFKTLSKNFASPLLLFLIVYLTPVVLKQLLICVNRSADLVSSCNNAIVWVRLCWRSWQQISKYITWSMTIYIARKGRMRDNASLGHLVSTALYFKENNVVDIQAWVCVEPHCALNFIIIYTKLFII